MPSLRPGIKEMKINKTILSLFDYTGNWSAPYLRAGYNVIRQDIQLGQDIFDDTIPLANYYRAEGISIHGVLAAAPCDDFANSGARWWAGKSNQPAPYAGENVDFDDRLEFFTAMVLAVLLIVEWLNPVWWALENPRGRIRKIVPELGPARLIFQPFQYGDPYTKETFIYGNFNTDLPQNPVLPLYGSMMHRMSSNLKNRRSETPCGFAKAFFLANP